MPKQRLLSKIWDLLKNTVLKFQDEHTMGLAAALAYYTIFSLPPLLIVIIRASSFLLQGEQVQNEIYNQLSALVGPKSILQLRDTISHMNFLKATVFSTSISLITLFITSTSLFINVQTSLNIIFRVKAKPKRGYVKVLRDRAISFAMILGLALILIATLVIEAVLNYFDNYLDAHLPRLGIFFTHASTYIIPFTIVSFFFAMVFKYLPDAKIKWRDTIVGAMVTSLLFSVGKFLISYYVSKTSVGNIYDAAGSILVLLVWIFYTATIFFFGAQFTYVYARLFGSHIRPSSYAVRIIQKEIEVDEEFSH